MLISPRLGSFLRFWSVWIVASRNLPSPKPHHGVDHVLHLCRVNFGERDVSERRDKVSANRAFHAASCVWLEIGHSDAAELGDICRKRHTVFDFTNGNLGLTVRLVHDRLRQFSGLSLA